MQSQTPARRGAPLPPRAATDFNSFWAKLACSTRHPQQNKGRSVGNYEKTGKSTSIEASGLAASPSHMQLIFSLGNARSPGTCRPPASGFRSSCRKNASPLHLQVKTSEGRSWAGDLCWFYRGRIFFPPDKNHLLRYKDERAARSSGAFHRAPTSPPTCAWDSHTDPCRKNLPALPELPPQLQLPEVAEITSNSYFFFSISIQMYTYFFLHNSYYNSYNSF